MIGGSGLEGLFEGGERATVMTPYGSIGYSIVEERGIELLFIPRHGFGHGLPPHKVNYRGLIWSARWWGTTHIIATNAVGSMREEFEPGDLVIPDQFMDFTKSRPTTFYDDEVVHTDMTEPYSMEIRDALRKAAEDVGHPIHHGGVYVCTEGPRYETPAEIRAYRTLGGDIVGMTGVPEVVLAREADIEYATLAAVTNYAAGMQSRISHEEVVELMSKLNPVLKDVIVGAAEIILEEG